MWALRPHLVLVLLHQLERTLQHGSGVAEHYVPLVAAMLAAAIFEDLLQALWYKQHHATFGCKQGAHVIEDVVDVGRDI